MPYRVTPFINEGYYHVFNRGVNKLNIFVNERDFNQAMLSIDYYRFEKPPVKLSRFKSLPVTDQSRMITVMLNNNKTLIDILCFVLMPNHWHFLLKQNIDNGISKFIANFSNSYARYFSTSHQWEGHLFQGQFKAVEIESEAQLIHVSRYIHLNPLVSGITSNESLKYYKWSSFSDYLKNNSQKVQTEDIMRYFKTPLDYEKFIISYADYARELEFIKHLTIDIKPD